MNCRRKHKYLSLTQIFQLLSQKDKFKQDAAENKMMDRKRKCTRKADDLEKALYTWFAMHARAQDAAITTVILEENHLC